MKTVGDFGSGNVALTVEVQSSAWERLRAEIQTTQLFPTKAMHLRRVAAVRHKFC